MLTTFRARKHANAKFVLIVCTVNSFEVFVDGI